MEKTFSLRYQEILGRPLPGAGRWARSLVYEPADKKALAMRGKLFVVATLSGPKNFDATLAGKLVLDSLLEEYYSLLDGSPLQALEKALITSHHRLVDLAYGSAGGGEVDFNIVAAALWGNILYLAKLGAGAVYLLRGEDISEVGPSEEAQVSVASGWVKGGDVIILGSVKFKEIFPPQRLKEGLERLDEAVKETFGNDDLIGLIIRLDLKEMPSEKEIIRFALPAKGRWPLGLIGLGAFVAGLKNLFLGRRGGPHLKLRPPGGRFGRGGRRAPSKIGSRLSLFLLAALFLVSVAFTLKRQRGKRVEEEVAKLLSESEESLRSADDLVDLNNERARQFLEEAKAGARRMEVLGAKTQAEEVLKKVKTARETLDKLIAVKPDLLYDFVIQDRESRPRSLAGDGDSLFAADPETNSLFKLSLRGAAKVERLGGGEVKKPLLVDFFDGSLYGLDEGGLFRLPLEGLFRGGLASPAAGGDKVADLRVYLGNVYLLLPAANQLLKFPALGEGLAGEVSWLSDEVDISRAASMAIDGSIYLFFRDGRVEKFTLGKRDEFRLTGLPEPLSEKVTLFTSYKLPYLYLLDREKKRVVVVSKDGFYQRQFILSPEVGSFDDLASFWVTAGGERLYFLDGSRVYGFDLGVNL